MTDVDPYEFFPINKHFEAELKLYKEKTRQEAIVKYGESETKKINDHVYKYARAAYFRNRDPKANKPPYSGFDIITHLSTGIIRSLLEPCSFMFDKAKDEYDIVERKCIDPVIQESVIDDMCQQKWNSIKEKMPRSVIGCTKQKSDQIYFLFDRLGDLFRARLLDPLASEPRAISF